MKNILIFIPNLQAGGAEKIAVNLSNIFNLKRKLFSKLNVWPRKAILISKV